MVRVGPSLAVLAFANVLNNRWLVRGYVPNCVATTIVLVFLARREGVSWAELGLDRRGARHGLAWALGSVAAVAAGYAVGYAVPATRAAFAGQRVEQGRGGAAYQALVPVPLGTVLLEEVAFRGVLWGLLNRRLGPGRATAASSLLFGLWHVLPARALPASNPALAGALGAGPRSTAALVPASVALTTAAGVGFCELRRRSGSLLGPAGLHWATNGLGYLFAGWAQRSPRPCAPGAGRRRPWDWCEGN